MEKSTSIIFDDHFDNFILHKIDIGQFSSASEVVIAALRLLEQKEKHKTELIQELTKGEKSGFIPKPGRKKFINGLHVKHVNY